MHQKKFLTQTPFDAVGDFQQWDLQVIRVPIRKHTKRPTNADRRRKSGTRSQHVMERGGWSTTWTKPLNHIQFWAQLLSIRTHAIGRALVLPCGRRQTDNGDTAK
jgi:hypothetical protein